MDQRSTGLCLAPEGGLWQGPEEEKGLELEREWWT